MRGSRRMRLPVSDPPGVAGIHRDGAQAAAARGRRRGRWERPPTSGGLCFRGA